MSHDLFASDVGLTTMMIGIIKVSMIQLQRPRPIRHHDADTGAAGTGVLVDGEDDVAADAEDDGRLLPHRTFARAPSSTATPVAHASTARSALKRSLKLMNAHLRNANRDALDIVAFI